MLEGGASMQRIQYRNWPEDPDFQSEPDLEIWVVFTKTRETLAALRTAARLAKSLSARIRLLAPHVVPFQLPLTSPPVSLEWSRRRLRELAVAESVDVEVDMRLCRDATDLVLNALNPHSIVVIGQRK